MAISFKKYVRITSGVGGGASVRTRDLILRVMTASMLIGADEVLEFTSATDVGDFFGTSTEEYRRAVRYFGYVSPLIGQPKRIAYGKYATADEAPRIFGTSAQRTLAQLQAITSGSLSFVFTQGGVGTPVVVSGINLSTATSLTNAAAMIQTALRANANPNLTTCTVVYDTVNARFTFEGAADGPIAISMASQTPLADVLGWTADARYVSGSLEQTALEAIIASAGISDNFGSFVFIPFDLLTLDEVTEVALWNKAENVKYQYYVAVTAANAAAWSAALLDVGGVGLTLQGPAAEYHEQIPSAIMAATDYTKRNQSTNYMYRQTAATTATVTDTTVSNNYDAIRINYYGETQTAGQMVEFYQRGTLMGLPTDPTDMNTYANEQWLKDAAGAAIMGAQLSLAQISANNAGRATLMAILQGVIDRALYNGTISAGKTLNDTQKAFIVSYTGDALAWHQVQDSGYWFDVIMQSETTQSGAVEWYATYSLLYGKNDAIRRVEGTHILI